MMIKHESSHYSFLQIFHSQLKNHQLCNYIKFVRYLSVFKAFNPAFLETSFQKFVVCFTLNL
jgi:hypothetical protein